VVAVGSRFTLLQSVGREGGGEGQLNYPCNFNRIML
jgi:hypothetical protein